MGRKEIEEVLNQLGEDGLDTRARACAARSTLGNGGLAILDTSTDARVEHFSGNEASLEGVNAVRAESRWVRVPNGDGID